MNAPHLNLPMMATLLLALARVPPDEPEPKDDAPPLEPDDAPPPPPLGSPLLFGGFCPGCGGRPGVDGPDRCTCTPRRKATR